MGVLNQLFFSYHSAQRNVYLTGFTLFLSLVLTRTFYITLDLIHAQEEYAKLNGTDSSSKKGSKNASGTSAGEYQTASINEGGRNSSSLFIDKDKEIATLKAKLRDFDVLKAQAKSQADEYNRLADRYNKLSGEKPISKKD